LGEYYIKEVFSNRPFNYEFTNKETIVQETKDTWIKGYEAKSEYDEYSDLPNQITITFDKETRKVKNIVLYLNHFNTSNVTIKHLVTIQEYNS